MNRRELLTCSAVGAAGTVWAYGTASILFGGASGRRLLNASYDATRELYRRLDRLFAERHPEVRVTPSHGGSGSQARAVIDGLPADVATLDPTSLISAALRAPVDLLWNGGIGTYVKA